VKKARMWLLEFEKSEHKTSVSYFTASVLVSFKT